MEVIAGDDGLKPKNVEVEIMEQLIHDLNNDDDSDLIDDVIPIKLTLDEHILAINDINGVQWKDWVHPNNNL